MSVTDVTAKFCGADGAPSGRSCAGHTRAVAGPVHGPGPTAFTARTSKPYSPGSSWISAVIHSCGQPRYVHAPAGATRYS